MGPHDGHRGVSSVASLRRRGRSCADEQRRRTCRSTSGYPKGGRGARGPWVATPPDVTPSRRPRRSCYRRTQDAARGRLDCQHGAVRPARKLSRIRWAAGPVNATQTPQKARSTATFQLRALGYPPASTAPDSGSYPEYLVSVRRFWALTSKRAELTPGRSLSGRRYANERS